MPTEILMPALSPTMEEGTLAKWYVKEGDTVSSGDILAEIETDKATMEYEAVDEGTIGQIIVSEGTEGVKVNSAIAILLEDGETAGDISAAPSSPKETTDPAPEIEAPQSAEAAPQSTVSAPKMQTQSPSNSTGERIFATPLARRIAEQKGLDLAQVTGSGPHGRIIKADVEAATPMAETAKTDTPTAVGAPQQVAAAGNTDAAVLATYADRSFTEVPLDGMRKVIAERLTTAKQTVPHFYLRRDINIDALMSFRKELNGQLEARGVKLSVNDFIIKACALALQEVPEANVVWAGDRRLLLDRSDISVAVAIEGGLFTPVLKDADQKSLSSLSQEMKDLATRARERKLAPHEYQGGSFSISNLGMFGIDNFDAIINPPQGAILAVGAGAKKPVVGASGELEVATIMSVTMSVDHRSIDGALGSQLLNAIKHNLESPMTMLA